MKYNLNQKEAGEEVLDAAYRISQEIGCEYADVVWLLTRVLAEKDTNTTAHKSLRSLIQSAKLAYGAELSHARDIARIEENYKQRMYAQKKALKAEIAQHARDVTINQRQIKIYEVFKWIRDHPGQYKRSQISEDELDKLMSNGLVTESLWTRKLKVPRNKRRCGRKDMPYNG